MCQDHLILTQTQVETEFAAALDGERAERFLAGLPGAREAVLARVLRAVAVEPLPPIARTSGHPADVVRQWAGSERLAAEVAHSVAGLALARTAKPLAT